MDKGAKSKHAAEPFWSTHATLIPELVHGCNVNEDIPPPPEQTGEHHVVHPNVINRQETLWYGEDSEEGPGTL